MALLARRPVPLGPQGGVYLRDDQTVRLAGWPEVELRLVSYQLPDYRWVCVLTDRFDLTASSVARLYKERWKIENWWKWIKTMLKIKRPLGESATALPLQLIAAFVTDLLWCVFKACGHFPASLYEFVTRCQELSLVRLADMADGALRQALERIRRSINSQCSLKRPAPHEFHHDALQLGRRGAPLALVLAWPNSFTTFFATVAIKGKVRKAKALPAHCRRACSKVASASPLRIIAGVKRSTRQPAKTPRCTSHRRYRWRIHLGCGTSAISA